MNGPSPSLRDWLQVNLKIGALSFGSASRVQLYEDEVVRRHGWLTPDEFQEVLTLAQLLPGPNLVNLSSYLGFRLIGTPGAIIGMMLLCLPGALMAALVAVAVPMDQPDIRELLRGFSIGALLLMGGFLWNLRRGIPKIHPTSPPLAPRRKLRRQIGRWIILATITVLSLAGVPVPMLLGGGIAACLAWEFLA